MWLAPLLWESEQKTADYFRSVVAVTSFGSSEKKKSWLSLALGGCPATSNAAMETRSKRRKTEPVVDKVRRGEISVVVALAEELPDLFAAEVLSKLNIWATLNLAQVSKSFNHAVWSVGGVRSMGPSSCTFCVSMAASEVKKVALRRGFCGELSEKPSG